MNKNKKGNNSVQKNRRESMDSLRYYKSVYENAPIGMFQSSTDGKLLKANQTFARIFGYASAAEAISSIQDVSTDIYVNPGDRDALIQEVLRNGYVNNLEIYYKRSDGSRFVANLHLQAIENADKSVAYFEGFVEDLSEKQIFEDQLIKGKHLLKIKEAQFRTFMENSPLLSFIKQDGNFTYVNHLFASFLSTTPEKIIGKDPEEIPNYHLCEIFFENDYQVLHQRKNVEYSKQTLDALKNERSLLIFKFPLKDQLGAISIGGLALDVTKHQSIEEALRISEARYRLVVENAQEGIWAMNGNYETVYVNKRMADMLGFRIADMLGKLVTDFMFPEDMKEHSERMMQRQKGLDGKYEQRFKRRDGGQLWCSVSATALINDNEFQGSFAMVADISNVKLAEQELRESLREKEVLLREVHHRVKNNLQIICSMMNLKTKYLNTSAEINILRDTESRIRSMALVHEALYQQNRFAKIDTEYYIAALIRDISRSYDVGHRIRIKTNIESCPLSIDAAIPCGLILNELLTNALKHAFSEEESGEIVVEFHHLEHGKCKLLVRDSGMGLPKDLNFNNLRSFGMEMIMTLVKQINGEVKMKRGNGFEFDLTFNRDNNHSGS